MLAAIGDARFENEEQYVSFLRSKIEEFSSPVSHTVDLTAADTVDGICAKLTMLPLTPTYGATLHLWIRSVIIDKDANLDVPLWHRLQEAVENLYHDGGLTCRVKLHLVGRKLAPRYGMHPKMAGAIRDGRLKVPTPYRVYRGGEEMAEITVTMEAGGASGVVSGMQFPVSNFRAIPRADGERALTLAELGVSPAEVGAAWKGAVAEAVLDSAEKLIQLLKVAAAASSKYGVTDANAIRAKLQARLKALNKLAPASLFNTLPCMSQGEVMLLDLLQSLVSSGRDGRDLLDENLIPLNRLVNEKLLQTMLQCVDSGDQKALGRAALITANYFPQMNGMPFDPAAANFDAVGVNAVIMAVGLLLRMHRGDSQLIAVLGLCHRFGLRVVEAAKHGPVKAKDGAKETQGGEDDIMWGSCGDCPRNSPDFDEAVVMEEGQPAPVFGAFAAGCSMVMAAMFGEDREGAGARGARARLGCNPDEPLVITKEACRLAALKMLAGIAA